MNETQQCYYEAHTCSDPTLFGTIFFGKLKKNNVLSTMYLT